MVRVGRGYGEMGEDGAGTGGVFTPDACSGRIPIGIYRSISRSK